MLKVIFISSLLHFLHGKRDPGQYITIFNSNNIFSKNYRNIDIEDKENKQELALIEINDMKWYKKIWKFIKGLLRK